MWLAHAKREGFILLRRPWRLYPNQILVERGPLISSSSSAANLFVGRGERMLGRKRCSRECNVVEVDLCPRR